MENEFGYLFVAPMPWALFSRPSPLGFSPIGLPLPGLLPSGLLPLGFLPLGLLPPGLLPLGLLPLGLLPLGLLPLGLSPLGLLSRSLGRGSPGRGSPGRGSPGRGSPGRRPAPVYLAHARKGGDRLDRLQDMVKKINNIFFIIILVGGRGGHLHIGAGLSQTQLIKQHSHHIEATSDRE